MTTTLGTPATPADDTITFSPAAAAAAAVTGGTEGQGASAAREFDLETDTVRDLNAALHSAADGEAFSVANPLGKHALAVGVNGDVRVDVHGHAGYYAAGMNQGGTITVHGNAGTGVAENMMSGRVHVTGDASQSAGATAHGGLLVIDGNASARCGISMKGIDIVVGGNIGHMSAFMAQAGRLVVCGDAGADLGDSIYEARIYVLGSVASLGSDCVAKEMRDEHRAELAELLAAAGRDDDPADFTRYGSARNLYHFDVDNSAAY
ncbi:protein glxC [Brevibacterium litoralis]|uniref:GltB/FmdC/FwdC-like GXGXG domain-containing protein n=1 Tax=Brevibacterium litoralis TaxID=3138935 RepID=UPI0032EE16B5